MQTHWEYRFVNVKDDNDGEDLYMLCEVYYDRQRILGYAPARLMSEDVEGLAWVANEVMLAVGRPPLTPDETWGAQTFGFQTND